MAVMPVECNPADSRCPLCKGLSEAQVPQTGDHTAQESVIQRECLSRCSLGTGQVEAQGAVLFRWTRYNLVVPLDKSKKTVAASTIP